MLRLLGFMNRKTMVLFGLSAVIISTLMISAVKAWPNDSIYVQDIGSRKITIDGKASSGEWNTAEEKYSDTVSGLSVFNASRVSYDLVMLRNSTTLFIKLTYTLNNYDGYIGNASIGFALSNNGPFNGLMSSSEDRHAFYHNATTPEVAANPAAVVYDLHNCKLTDNCNGTRSFYPGIMDDVQNGVGGFTYDTSTQVSTWELAMPLAGDGSVQDVTIQPGVYCLFIINPYQDIFTGNFTSDGQLAHGGKGTDQLQISFKARSFFPRPTGPMDPLAITFNLIFSLIIITISALFYFSARNDALAAKLWRVDITQEMADHSLLMEIGYYNSSFVSLFSLFYMWAYSLFAVIYGWWANWGGIGFAITIPTFIVASVAGVDLILRNENPQAPGYEKREIGKEVESTSSLWFFPPAFLGLTLFMLVFIGINVVTNG